MTQNNDYDNLGSDCFDKISASENIIQNNEQESGANDHELENDTENNPESDMDWTTVRHKNKRTRSGSNDAEKIDLDVTVSPNKKSKKSSATTDNGQKLDTKSVRKPRNNDRNELNKDSVLAV